jgi:hypothetical protein
MISIRNVDLNRDGTDEILAKGKGPKLCSATGNCGFWVFLKSSGRWRVILSGSDYDESDDFEGVVQRRSNRGYANILLKGHLSAAETIYRTYRFDGGRYIESRCMYEAPKVRRDGDGGWEMITCVELNRREKEALIQEQASQ